MCYGPESCIHMFKLFHPNNNNNNANPVLPQKWLVFHKSTFKQGLSMLTNPLTTVKFVLGFVWAWTDLSWRFVLHLCNSVFSFWRRQCIGKMCVYIYVYIIYMCVYIIYTQACCLVPSILIYLIKICLVHVPNSLPRQIQDVWTMKLLLLSCTTVVERISAACIIIIC